MKTNSEVLSNTIIKWAATRSDDAVFDPTKGYYPFHIIAEAFEKGIEHGEKGLKQNIRDKFFDNAKSVVEAINEMTEYLAKNKFTADKLFVKIAIDTSKIIFTLDEKVYLTDKFLDSAYSFVSKIQHDYFLKGVNLEIGFLNNSQTIDIHSLNADGFAIGLDLKTNKSIFKSEA